MNIFLFNFLLNIKNDHFISILIVYNFKNNIIHCYTLTKLFPIFYYTTTVQLAPVLVVSLIFYTLWRACHQNVFQQDDEYSTSSQSESKFKYSSVPKKNDEFVNSWMPPTPLVKSQFNAIVTNVDLECHVFFQILDDGMKKNNN